MKQDVVLAAIAIGGSGALADVTTDFESGADGWSVSGRDTVAATGNPGNGLDVQMIDVFGADLRNSTNSGFLGDLTRYGSAIELSVDVKVNSISSQFSTGEFSREFIVELRDYDNDNGFPYTSVWYSLGAINSSTTGEWTTLSVAIDDTSATALPIGWGGYGDEDPNTFAPILPADRTFTSVLQSVDEFAFTTFVPGFFFGFTDFDLQFDNISVRAVPAPGASVALIGGAAVVSRRRRR
ncbi:MAG: PEP-CTERM sorting domain-containing protein [Planctomycetota bacterium]